MKEFLKYLAIFIWLTLITLGGYFAAVMVSERLEAKTVQTDIFSNDDLHRSVEENLRQMIRLWEDDLDLYNRTADTDSKSIEEIHQHTKNRMNEIADAYNAYLQRYNYLFQDTLPDDIYAAIERIE